MAKHSMVSVSIFFFFTAFFISSSSAAFNVISFGAKPDGRSDSTLAFARTWTAACRSVKPATIAVPRGRYLIKAVEFRGPCRNKITFLIYGSLLAPSHYQALGNSASWILFVKVNRVAVYGGTIDAQGASQWACRISGKSCPTGATSLQFNWANNIVISGLTSINSKMFHFVINSCKNVMVRNVKLIAPDQSPNTDGIHVQYSSGVTIIGTDIKTGDDCISIGPGTSNLWMERIRCGPGHGISIGSLGRDLNEAGVYNVTLTDSVFTGSDNGVRIKSWARQSNGFVRSVVFRNILMNNVKNPIIIDQNYCPSNQGCPRQASSVKISRVTYKSIKGTSATPVAILFRCSTLNPCRGIRLEDIKLTYRNRAAASSCKNIGGTSGGTVTPQSCL